MKHPKMTTYNKTIVLNVHVDDVRALIYLHNSAIVICTTCKGHSIAHVHVSDITCSIRQFVCFQRAYGEPHI